MDKVELIRQYPPILGFDLLNLIRYLDDIEPQVSIRGRADGNGNGGCVVRLSRTISRLCHAAAWGGLLSASLWLVGFAVVPGYAQVLTHGPVTGGVDANNAKVFVRTGAAASVMVQYGTFPTLPHPNSSKPATTSALHDYTAIVQLK